MSSARNEVISVPTRKGSAPNFRVTGSHVRPVRNLKPRAFIEGREAMSNERKIAMRSTSTLMPAR